MLSPLKTQYELEGMYRLFRDLMLSSKLDSQSKRQVSDVFMDHPGVLEKYGNIAIITGVQRVGANG